ncbi:MAG: hypothetical protein NVV63_06210 [Opitutus sp.]|nr:hypothetical protein [Opitutus sp.]
MNLSPENEKNLERLVHQALRSLPERRAPRSLESRVLAAIEARAARPWWQKSFAQWPVAARATFLVVSTFALLFAAWFAGVFSLAPVADVVVAKFSWVTAIRSAFSELGEVGAMLLRNVPAMWLYGALAAVGLLYAALFGLGATAYRTLYAHR